MKLLSTLSLALTLSFSVFVSAADDTRSATFVYNSTRETNFFTSKYAFSLNAVQSSGDIYFHLEAPVSGSWAAVGFGSQMSGSLILVAYPSSNGTGVTISPRIATGHTEPTYTQDVKVDMIWDSGLKNGNSVNTTSNIMYVNGVCKKCTSWSGGKLDLADKNAPFIFAMGPGGDLNSDDLAASLDRHAFYGHFTMDMTAATSQSQGAVPQGANGVYTRSNASDGQDTKGDHDVPLRVHAFLMIVTWILIFPFGSLLLRALNKVILHAVVQGFGVVLILIATALGIRTGLQYNKTKNFQNGHQILGLLLVAGLLAQLGLGIVNHRIFKRTQRPSIMGKIHLILGPGLIVLAIVNGGLGFNLAGDGWITTRYAIGVVAVFLVFFAARTAAHVCMRRRNKQQPPLHNGAPPEYQYPEYAPHQPYAQHVPLRSYDSSDHVPQMHPQQPRPMV